MSRFEEIAEIVQRLLENCDEPAEMSKALIDGDFDRAQELSGIPESEFVELFERLNDLTEQ